MVVFINTLTGTEMLVADNRKDEYLAAGYKLAVNNSETEKAETVTPEPKKTPAKKSTATKKK